MKTLVVLAVVFLVGCASTPKGPTLDEACSSYIGSPISNLINGWGVPQTQYDVDASTKIVEYIHSSSRTVGMHPYGSSYAIARTDNLTCIVDFTVENGTVTKYSWKGNWCQ